MSDKPKIIAVVGPTSSGKTAISVEIAKRFNGEVISADSRQVYRGLDLGTGKVTVEEMQGIQHHLLDVANPMEVYTAADFERDAKAAIADIQRRGKTPVVAGGTFFYLDILRGKQQSAPVEPDESFRASLFDFSNLDLFQKIKGADPARANTIDPNNRHRLVRALEIINALGTVPKHVPAESPFQWLIVGLKIQKIRLHQNIRTRLLTRLEAGMATEIEYLHKEGLTYERMHKLGLEYRYMAMYLQQEISHDEMVAQLETKTRQFAKRQRTWLKRDSDIEWFMPEDYENISHCVSKFLHGTNS
jgi:tRNA dimethylallyltransferase